MTDKETFKEFLHSKPVAFYPDFSEIGGSTNAGILLSQLFYWRDKQQDADGWIYKSQKDWKKEISLTRTEQENARKKLRDAKILQEKLKGNPAKLYFKIDFDKMIEALSSLYESRAKDAVNLHAENIQAKVVGNLHTSMQESSILSLTKNTSKTTTDISEAKASGSLYKQVVDLIGKAHKHLTKDDLVWKNKEGRYGKATKQILEIVAHESPEVAFAKIREKCAAYVAAAQTDKFLKTQGVTPVSILDSWNKVHYKPNMIKGAFGESQKQFPKYQDMSPEQIQAAFAKWNKYYTVLDLKANISPQSYEKFVREANGYAPALVDILIEEVHAQKKTA
jgi:hypothetical protein